MYSNFESHCATVYFVDILSQRVLTADQSSHQEKFRNTVGQEIYRNILFTIPALHTNCHMKEHTDPQVDYHTEGKWFIHGPKRHKED